MTPQRREPGIRRRLRVWWVRRTLWEKAQQERGRPAPELARVTYGRPWFSLNSLSKWSDSCDQHRVCLVARAESRYSAADRRREKAVPA